MGLLNIQVPIITVILFSSQNYLVTIFISLLSGFNFIIFVQNMQKHIAEKDE